jgi:hypothetical protein
MNKHLAAIRSGNVTKTNVIGLRKALNADARRLAGYSVSSVAPKLKGAELAAIIAELEAKEPLVRGSLHESGVRIVTGPRYAKRFDSVRHVVDSLHGFRLVRFDDVAEVGAVPVYRAIGSAGSFLFRVIAWQSGGDGPELVS